MSEAVRQTRVRLRPALWTAAALVWLLPLLATQFTREVNWGSEDFAALAVLLIGACGAYELAAGSGRSARYRAGLGVGLAGAFLLVWMNLAVGIIGREDNPANLMFAGVLAVGLAGVAMARLHPRGMARAAVATALAQIGVAGIAVMAGWGSAVAVLVVSGLFAALWLTAAWLLRSDAQAQGDANRTAFSKLKGDKGSQPPGARTGSSVL